METPPPSPAERREAALVHLRSVLLAGLSLLIVDLVWLGEAPGAMVFGSALGLVVLGALLVGAAWAAALGTMAMPPAGFGPAAIAVVAAGGAHALNLALGVYPRLHGPHSNLAWFAMLGSGGLAGSLFVLGLVLRPTRGYPRGWLASQRVTVVGAGALLLVGVSAGAIVGDRTIEVGDYEPAHLALRLLAVVTLGSALYLCLPFLERVRAGRLLPIILVAAAVPFFTLEDAPRLQHAVHSLTYPGTVLSLLRAGSDVDGDGYSHLLGGADCDWNDPGVHPGATDVPGNGKDENCLLGDARPRLDRDADAPEANGPSPVSVVLVTVDSLAASRIGVYGGNPKVAIHIDRWSKHALRFDHAFTSGAWTSLALSSLFRGLYARKLRWSHVLETNIFRMLRPEQVPDALKPRERVRRLFVLPLEDPRRTLPQWLQRRGMRTLAVVDDGYTEVLSGKLGGFPGFDRYLELAPTQSRRPRDRQVTKRAVEVLKKQKKSEPFFLWVHYFGPHPPDTRHRDLPKFGEGKAGAYDQEIRYLDRHIRPLLRALEATGRRMPLVSILTSDHGEVLRPGWRGHGRDLSEAGLRIPLFIRGPGFDKGSTDVPASLVDIMPTVLGITRTPAPEDVDGRNLKKLVVDRKPRVLFSDTWRLRVGGRRRLDLAAAFDGQYKVSQDMMRVDRWYGRQIPPDASGAGQLRAETRRDDDSIPSERRHALRDALDGYIEQFGDIWL